jgi:hypothetical protein
MVPAGRRGGRSADANVGRAGVAGADGGLRGGAGSFVEDGVRVHMRCGRLAHRVGPDQGRGRMGEVGGEGDCVKKSHKENRPSFFFLFLLINAYASVREAGKPPELIPTCTLFLDFQQSNTEYNNSRTNLIQTLLHPKASFRTDNFFGAEKHPIGTIQLKFEPSLG